MYRGGVCPAPHADLPNADPSPPDADPSPWMQTPLPLGKPPCPFPMHAVTLFGAIIIDHQVTKNLKVDF